MSYLRMCFSKNLGDADFDFQQFWGNHHHQVPILADTCVSVSIAPLTSVSSESSFSVAGHVNRKERSRLDPETLTLTMLLKGKKKVVELVDKYHL